MQPLNNKQSGFTLVEMIVSLALFSIVAMVAVGALLMLISSNVQLQNEQSVMTNLSFALDSMTREIRTGTDYFCDDSNNLTGSMNGVQNMFNDNNDLDTIFNVHKTRDCAAGNNGGGTNLNYQGLAFKEGGHSITGSGDRILYFFNKNEGKIYRRVGAEAAQSIVSSGIVITQAEFYVSGSTPLSDGPGNRDQASVTIFIEAREVDDINNEHPYQIQSTIVQRALDI